MVFETSNWHRGLMCTQYSLCISNGGWMTRLGFMFFWPWQNMSCCSMPRLAAAWDPTSRNRTNLEDLVKSGSDRSCTNIHGIMFIVFDWECGFSLLFNLRPSGVNRSFASKARATTGKRMWRRVTLTCEEICLGWMARGSCWDGQMSTSRTSRPSPRSTSTDTFVSSRMP